MRDLVVFACVHNAGRSQMAAAFFDQLADPAKARAVSAGTEPGARVHPEVVAAMAEVGIDLSAARPTRLTREFAESATLLVTMGCGEACPSVPGSSREDWPLPDPKGQPIDRVRAIRDEVRSRVQRLVELRDWHSEASTFRLSTPADDDALRALLREASLPTEDVATGTQQYVLAFAGERLVGAVGLEVAREDGLLRSLAVRPDRRRSGLGSALVERVLALGSQRGVRTMYLLTTTARDYFAKMRFEPVERSEVPPRIGEHLQFRSLCPATAVCMRRRIDRDAADGPAAK